jgi:hypothetical protein
MRSDAEREQRQREGARLRQLRWAANFPRQHDLAEALIARASKMGSPKLPNLDALIKRISKWECGDSRPTKYRQLLADVLGCHVRDLVALQELAPLRLPGLTAFDSQSYVVGRLSSAELLSLGAQLSDGQHVEIRIGVTRGST